MWRGGESLSIVIHSFIAPHSLVYNTYKYFSNKLFIHFILLHSYTVPAFLHAMIHTYMYAFLRDKDSQERTS